MQALNTMITDLLGPFGHVLLAGFLGVILILCTLPVLLRRQADPLDKLKSPVQKAPKANVKEQRLREAKKKDQLEKYATFLEPQDAEQYSAIRLKLLQAGYKSKNGRRVKAGHHNQ